MANKIIQLTDGTDNIFTQVFRGLDNPTQLTNNDDMNTVLTVGCYYQDGATLPVNAPQSAYNAFILVARARIVDRIQIWISINQSKIYWRRTNNSGTTWTDWVTINQT